MPLSPELQKLDQYLQAKGLDTTPKKTQTQYDVDLVAETAVQTVLDTDTLAFMILDLMDEVEQLKSEIKELKGGN
ncbi:hypothetical protein HWB91_gp08 [Bacillus phage vB_BboS-125]|uniref:Uncharacterized protein n=1 Tax=Bacillus phage vB_BboS-125 TaxID=2419618 RepID=A0A3G3BVV2_9CAUD|nr:hypothetical protein HWB91_gp08 [Bacillus phage vB_BboS-125]AYP68378.1 hypothetical protein BboS125_00008 [Bacillus phage vB_BboS-125]